VSSDRTLSLRRLIFQETIQSPDIGQYYYEIGPQVAYLHLEKIFTAHKGETDFDPENLTHYFIAMTLHRAMLQRECGVLKPLSKKQMAAHAAEVTDNFIKAFLRK
jgi:hypothetical protein